VLSLILDEQPLTRKAILPILILILFTVPFAQCFTIDNALFNFQATHGGVVRFANSVVTAQISVIDAITRFNTLVIGGANRGNLAFDCDALTVMVITGVTANTVQYTITAAGQVDSYVYYGNRLSEPVGTNTDAVVYNAATGITTVTTTGNVAVTLTYTAPELATPDLTETGVNLINAFLLITITSIFLYVGGSKVGISDETLLNLVILIAFFMAVVYMAAGMGL